jgi:hypothetical protein
LNQPADAGGYSTSDEEHLVDIPRLTLPLAWTSGGTPIYPVFGAVEVEPDEGEEPELDEPEEDEEPADDDGKKGKGKGADRYVPPTESEWARVRTSLDKANASAKAKREAAQRLERENQALRDEKAARDAAEERRQLLESRQPAPVPDSGGKKGRGQQLPAAPPADLPAGVLTPAQVKAELAKAKREERETVQAEYLDMARRSAARVALSDAQVPKASLGRLIKLIDLDEVELDSDGEVVSGLDDQIALLREELPQLFAPVDPEPVKRTRPKPPRIPAANGSSRPPAQERKLSTAEQIAESVLGGR